jgi:hypothetical protein
MKYLLPEMKDDNYNRAKNISPLRNGNKNFNSRKYFIGNKISLIVIHFKILKIIRRLQTHIFQKYKC